MTGRKVPPSEPITAKLTSAPGMAPRLAACDLYADSVEWSRKAILNVASSGRFSSDRTIAECD
jgi:Carbohydrate phosphorylase